MTAIVIPAVATIVAAIITGLAARDRRSRLLQEAELLSKLEKDSPLRVMLAAKVEKGVYEIIEAEELGFIGRVYKGLVIFGATHALGGWMMLYLPSWPRAPFSGISTIVTIVGWTTLLIGVAELLLGTYLTWRFRRTTQANFRAKLSPLGPLDALNVWLDRKLESLKTLDEKVDTLIAAVTTTEEPSGPIDTDTDPVQSDPKSSQN